MQRDPHATVQKMLNAREELRRRESTIVYFNEIYLLITERLLEVAAISRDLEHRDHQQFEKIEARFMENLVAVFADRYLHALAAWLADKESAPTLWKKAFDRCGEIHDGGTAILMCALVHMSFDLPLALNTPLNCGKRVFQSDDPKHVLTYLAIDEIISDLQPAMGQRTKHLQTLMRRTISQNRSSKNNTDSAQQSWWLSRSLFRWLIYLTRQEARWMQTKLSQGSLTQPQLQMIIDNRLRLIKGDGSLFWYFLFLAYGLIARLKNRTSLPNPIH